MHLTGAGGAHGGIGIGGQLEQLRSADWRSCSVKLSMTAADAGVPHVDTQAFVSQSVPQSASFSQALVVVTSSLCSPL